jgi:hypothetical protein
MPVFADFLKDLADRRSLRREPDGARVTYRLKLAGSASITIVTDELDANWPCLVMSEPWPVPNTDAAHMEFMREALRFNRNAMHHLHCGVRRDPNGSPQYRLLWEVPLAQQDAAHWTAQLQLFGRLTDKAWETLPRPGWRTGRKSTDADDTHMIFMP